MRKTYFHATSYDNLTSIYEYGIMPSSIEGIVYLCQTAIDCLKFMKLRGLTNILVLEVVLPDKDVFETFDHSKDFFKCKCFGINRLIKTSEIKSYWKYTI